MKISLTYMLYQNSVTNGLGWEQYVSCIDSLVQDCNNSSALAMELLQSRIKTSIRTEF